MKIKFCYKDSQFNVTMSRANQQWQKHNHNMRQKLKGKTFEQCKLMMPKGITSEDREVLCVHEFEEEQKQLCERNKNNKQRSEATTTHNTGRDGYARCEYQMEKEYWREVARPELWLVTHKMKCTDEYATWDQATTDALRENLIGPEVPLVDDSLAKAKGKECRGRTRGVGPVSLNSIKASQYARDLLHEAESRKEETRKEFNEFKDELKNELKNELRNDISAGIEAALRKHSTFGMTSSSSSNVQAPLFASSAQVSGKLICCKIKDYTGKVIGQGRKSLPGSYPIVHGHEMSPNEVRVIVDRVDIGDAPLWKGK